jgi:hypothetical protein
VTSSTIRCLVVGLCLTVIATASPVYAQQPDAQPPDAQPTDVEQAGTQPPDAQPPKARPDDEAFRPAEPDFTLVALQTGLPLPLFKSAVRITHRFTYALNQGSFSDLASNLFGFDSSPQVGLEYRIGIIPHGQVGIHRTSDRTIEFFTEYQLVPEGQWLPFAVSAYGSIEGTNNFNKNGSHTPAVGAIVSKTFQQHLALYFEPIYVNNSNPLPAQLVDHNDTFVIGIGARVRVTSSVYVVAEYDPRAAGYKPGVNQASFGVEKRIGGHTFQLNFSNGLGTTIGQIARGGDPAKDWFIGFNLSRKFY